MSYPTLPSSISQLLREGTVIPAHPLALTKERRLDEKRQKLLTQYYMTSGAGGVAVGVHTTQFEIRKPEVNLLEPVLRLASEQISESNHGKPFIKVAGIVGPTQQALREAELAVKHGYHLGLVSMGGLNDQRESDLIKRLEAIAEIIPVFGFYLQPAVGGRLLSYDFWKDAASIPSLYAIKVAAFNRYQTLMWCGRCARRPGMMTLRCIPAMTTTSWPTCSPLIALMLMANKLKKDLSADFLATGRSGPARR